MEIFRITYYDKNNEFYDNNANWYDIGTLVFQENTDASCLVFKNKKL